MAGPLLGDDAAARPVAGDGWHCRARRAAVPAPAPRPPGSATKQRKGQAAKGARAESLAVEGSVCTMLLCFSGDAKANKSPNFARSKWSLSKKL